MSTQSRAERPRAESLFRNRNFALLWFGSSVSLLGDGVFQLALMWWVLEETGSIAAMATVSICATLPMVLLGMPAGSYVDRLDRRRLMISADVFRAALMFLAALLLARGQLQLWHIYLGAALSSAATAFFNPAFQAVLPNVVEKEELTRANSLLQTSVYGSNILGPIIGGIVVGLLGTAGAMILDAVSYVISGLAILLASFPAVAAGGRGEAVLASTLEGLRYIGSSPVLLGMISLACLLNFVVAPAGFLLPVMARDYLALGPEGYGLLAGILSAGMLAGAIALGVKGKFKSRSLGIMAGLIIIGIGFAAFGLSRMMVLAGASLFAAGTGFAVTNILFSTVVQERVPDDRRGRVFGAIGAVAMGLRPVALAVVGVVADSFGAPTVIVVSGLSFVVASAAMRVVPALRDI